MRTGAIVSGAAPGPLPFSIFPEAIVAIQVGVLHLDVVVDVDFISRVSAFTRPWRWRSVIVTVVMSLAATIKIESIHTRLASDHGWPRRTGWPGWTCRSEGDHGTLAGAGVIVLVFLKELSVSSTAGPGFILVAVVAIVLIVRWFSAAGGLVRRSLLNHWRLAILLALSIEATSIPSLGRREVAIGEVHVGSPVSGHEGQNCAACQKKRSNNLTSGQGEEDNEGLTPLGSELEELKLSDAVIVEKQVSRRMEQKVNSKTRREVGTPHESCGCDTRWIESGEVELPIGLWSR